MNQKRLVSSLVAILVALLGFYVFMSIEVYEEEQDVKLSFKSWRTPYLAAQKLMQKQGVEFDSLENYRRLFSNLTDQIVPTVDDTLILTDAEIYLTDTLSENILAWVDSGGHLIFATSHSTGRAEGNYQANALFNALNISIDYIVDEDDFLQEQDPTSLSLGDYSEDIEVNLENSYRIVFDDSEEPYYQAGDDKGTTFAQLERGEGLITLMTNVSVWNNHQIGQYDNAVLLDFLTSSSDQIYLFKPKLFKHWFTLLLEFAPVFIWIGLVGIALSIWHYGRRFGPVQISSKGEFSGFSQHVKAAGEYYWRSKKRDMLLDDLRHLVLRDVARKWPNSQNLPIDKKIELLCQISQWTPQSVEQLLTDESPLNEAKFTQYTKAIQQLRNML